MALVLVARALSPQAMANWFTASCHSLAARSQSTVMLRKATVFAIPRHLQPKPIVLSEHRLAAGFVAMVAGVLGLIRPRREAKVTRELGSPRPLDQRLLERYPTASAVIGPVTN